MRLRCLLRGHEWTGTREDRGSYVVVRRICGRRWCRRGEVLLFSGPVLLDRKKLRDVYDPDPWVFHGSGGR